MNPEITTYNALLTLEDQAIAHTLATVINEQLPEAESKIWHAHPVWFLDGNPVVGYSKLKYNMRLLFWSGQSFEEKELDPEGKFKAAEKRFTHVDQINIPLLRKWIDKSKAIQWDYKNIVKRKGLLLRLK